MRYTGEQLGRMAGMTRQTFMREVERLNIEKKFVKTSPVKGFSEADATRLSQLLGFTIKQVSNGRNGKTKRVKRNGKKTNR